MTVPVAVISVWDTRAASSALKEPTSHVEPVVARSTPKNVTTLIALCNVLRVSEQFATPTNIVPYVSVHILYATEQSTIRHIPALR